MRRNIPTALLVLGAALVPGVRADEPGRPKAGPAGTTPFCVAGYLPDYRVKSFDPDQAKLLTDLIYFSAQPEPTGELNEKRLRPDALPQPDRLVGLPFVGRLDLPSGRQDAQLAVGPGQRPFEPQQRPHFGHPIGHRRVV